MTHSEYPSELIRNPEAQEALEAILDDPLKALTLGILAEAYGTALMPRHILQGINAVLELSEDPAEEYGVKPEPDQEYGILAACQELAVAKLVKIYETDDDDREDSLDVLIQITEKGLQIGLPIAGIGLGWQLENASLKDVFRSRRQLRLSIIGLIIMGVAGTVIKVADILATTPYEVNKQIHELVGAGVLTLTKPDIALDSTKPVSSPRPTTAKAALASVIATGNDTAKVPPTPPKASTSNHNTIEKHAAQQPTQEFRATHTSSAPSHARPASSSNTQTSSAATVRNQSHPVINPSVDVFTVAPEHKPALTRLVNDLQEVLDQRAEPSERARRQATAITKEPGFVRRLWHERKRRKQTDKPPTTPKPQRSGPSGGGSSDTRYQSSKPSPGSLSGESLSIENVQYYLLLVADILDSGTRPSVRHTLIGAWDALDQAKNHAAYVVRLAQTVVAAEDVPEALQTIETWTQNYNTLDKLQEDLVTHIEGATGNGGTSDLIRRIAYNL